MSSAVPITTADVVFAEATPEQRTISWELNGASWAPPMTLAEYIGRETTLANTSLSANRGTRYYALHLKSDPLVVVSACEVTIKRALVADKGGVREVVAYSIASVFTAPAHRGHGLAAHLLRCVQKAVDTELNAECGVLYSDIGRKFYTALGWKDFGSPQLTLKLEARYTALPRPDGEPEVALLSSDDVAPLCEKDVALQRQRFETLAAEAAEDKTHVAFIPSHTQMAWHFARDAYVAGVMCDGREVVYRGAKTVDGASWLYWDHDLRERKLKVLRIVVTTSSAAQATADVKSLLRAALAEASSWNLPKVLVWGPSSSACVAATQLWQEAGDTLQILLDERQDGSIPSLRWKGDKAPGAAVVWEDNDYFAWC